MARKLDYSSSTASRLLLTLEHLDYVYQDPKTKKYRICNKMDLKEISYPFMKELSEKTGETIAIGALKNAEISHIARIESTESLKATFTNAELPAYAFAIGKYLLAWKNEEDIDELLPLSFEKRTENTITALNELKKELEFIRKNNYAMDNEEGYEGVRCIATGIYDHNNEIIAGISIIAPAYRFDDSLIPIYKDYLLQIAQKISEKIKSVNNSLSIL